MTVVCYIPSLVHCVRIMQPQGETGITGRLISGNQISKRFPGGVAALNSCSQEVIVQQNILQRVYCGGRRFIGKYLNIVFGSYLVPSYVTNHCGIVF